jgi:hypothetical protein
MIDPLHAWLEAQLLLLLGPSTLAEAIPYALARSHGLTCFLHDGRVELDTNPVERAFRPAPPQGVSIALAATLSAGRTSGSPALLIRPQHVDRGT